MHLRTDNTVSLISVLYYNNGRSDRMEISINSARIDRRSIMKRISINQFIINLIPHFHSIVNV